MLEQIVLGELDRLLVVEDCIGFRRELGINVEQALERLFSGQLRVQLGQKGPTLAQGPLQFCLLVIGFVCGFGKCLCLLLNAK